MFAVRGAGIFGLCRHPLAARWPEWRLYSTKSYDPLRILFCGSDEFSIASLKALHAYHLKEPSRIASIDVVCRPGKRVGRGLKKIREGKPSFSSNCGLRFLIQSLSTDQGGCLWSLASYS